MTVRRIVIAGFGHAGYAALMSIRRNDPSPEIIIIDPSEYDREYPGRIPCAIRKILPADCIRSDINLEGLRAERIVASVAQVIPDSRTVVAVTDSREHRFTYDSLILCTGQRQKVPDLHGIESVLDTGIFRLDRAGAYESIINAASSGGRAAVIGAGPSGLEMAFALNDLCSSVTVLESGDRALSRLLDPELSSIVEKAMSDLDITFLPGYTVDGISVDTRFTGLTSSGKHLSADFAVLASGHVPATEAASGSGIDYDNCGISVDDYLSTSVDNIYAAGNCIACPSVIDSRRFRPGRAAASHRQGIIAGLNATGKRSVYRGSAGTFLTRLADLEISSTGYTTEQALSHGYDPVSGMARCTVTPECVPDAHEITLKVVFDRQTGKILGAQAAGKSGCAERINLVSTLIGFDIPVYEAGRIEMGCHPLMSQVNDPLFRAIDFGLKKL